MGEAKLRKKLGISPKEDWMTIGVIATDYDHVQNGIIPLATALIKMPVRDIERLARLGLSKGNAVQAIKECFDQELHMAGDDPTFGKAVAAYIGQTRNFKIAKSIGVDGYWMKLFKKAGKARTRVVMLAESAVIMKTMDDVHNGRLDDEGWITSVFPLPDHPTDAEFVGGKVAVRDGQAIFNDKPVRIGIGQPPAGQNQVQ
jgi:hypothetical protein